MPVVAGTFVLYCQPAAKRLQASNPPWIVSDDFGSDANAAGEKNDRAVP
jgi:hypothetical protein